MISKIIQSMIIILIESVCCKFFLDTFMLRRDYKAKWINKMMVPIMVMGLTIVVTFTQNNLIKSILIIMISMGIVKLYYYASALQNLVLSAIYYGIMIGIDYVLLIFVNYLSSEKYMYILNNTVSATIIALLCKIVLFLVVLAIRKKWKTEDSLDRITNTEWVRLAYFPIFTIISMVSMLVSFGYNEEIPKVLLIIAFGIVIMNFIVFYMIHDIVNREADMQNSRLIQERTKNQMNNYNNMRDSYERQRKRIHDYKNQLNCIQGMLIRGKTKETIEYIINLTGSLAKDIDAINTENTVADAVINLKYRYAQSKGITLLMIVNNLSELLINEEDLVTILSNILDNAIEACEKVESNKVIKFKMTYEKNQLIISVKNPIMEPLKIINNKIITTKENKKEHGIGLLNIYAVVDKYKGTCAIQSKDGWFYLSALIPYETVE